MSDELRHFASQVSADADANRVRYSFSCTDVHERFVVTSFDATEELGRPYRLAIQLTAEDETTDASALLGREAMFTLERASSVHRTFYGIIGRVSVGEHNDALQASVVDVVPALEALRFSRNTRIFQDMTPLEIVETVLTEELGRYVSLI